MKYIFANWKMYLDYEESVKLAQSLLKEKIDSTKLEVAVFPNFLAIHDVVEALKKTSIAVGAQNVSWSPQGAYTGAVSAYLIKRIGCTYALVGHSERRYIFGEHDDDVRKKIEACLTEGLVPVVCVGETKEDMENEKRQYRLKKQLMKALGGLQLNGNKILIAYEPVWAIGSGTPCDPAEADDVQGWIKQEVKQYLLQDVPVLYGGSVDPENVLSYLSREMVDGVLVGSASAKRDSLLLLLAAAQRVSP